LLAVVRVALQFQNPKRRVRVPAWNVLQRYGGLLAAEADQIDRLVGGAYTAMWNFELFAAHSMLYFAAVSFAEVAQRLSPAADDAWRGFLGVGDAQFEPLSSESLDRIRRVPRRDAAESTPAVRQYAGWVEQAIAPRNVAGLADERRHNLYPLDLELLVERHTRLGLTRSQVLDALPALRGSPTAEDHNLLTRARGA
jgi:FADH2 O2-dependent halogenase